MKAMAASTVEIYSQAFRNHLNLIILTPPLHFSHLILLHILIQLLLHHINLLHFNFLTHPFLLHLILHLLNF